MSEFPVQWTTFTLSELGGLSGGKTPSKANQSFWASRDVPWVSPKDIKNFHITDSEDRISEAALRSASMVLYPASSILMVTRSGILQHTFPVAMAKVDVTVNQDIKVAKPSDNVDPDFLLYALRALGQTVLQTCSKAGTTVQSIDTENLEALRIPLPPLPEQKRIAQKLDALLAQVDTLKARIDAIPALLKRFRYATLSAAANGDLTQDWREGTEATQGRESANQYLSRILEARRISPRTKFKPPAAPDNRNTEVPATWVVSSVSSFAECLDSMRVPVKKELRAREGGTYPYFGANGEVDRVDEFIFDDDLVLVTEDETFYGRVKPIAYKYSGKCWVNNHVHALRAHDKVGQSFLCYILMHYDVIPWLTGTTGRAKLTQGALLALPIGVPPPDEQAEIVRRVEKLFAFADQLEARVRAARKRIDTLTQSLLAKAFRGELVPQDPNDEPASVLLERIRAQRAAEPKPKRGRKATVN